MSWKNKLSGQNGRGGLPAKDDPSADRSPGAYLGYRSAFTAALRGIEKCSVYDIDVVIEQNSMLRSLFEYKRYEKTYSQVLMPYNQYVVMKKWAARLEIPAYLVVEQGRGKGPGSGEGSSFWVVEFNPAERPADRPGVEMKGSKGLFAPWSAEEGAVLSAEDFTEFCQWIARGRVGDL